MEELSWGGFLTVDRFSVLLKSIGMRVWVGGTNTEASVQLSLMCTDQVVVGCGAADDEFVPFSFSDKKIRVWDLKTGKCVRELS
eukprot:657973-Hanusia_phi.AAC.1